MYVNSCAKPFIPVYIFLSMCMYTHLCETAFNCSVYVYVNIFIYIYMYIKCSFTKVCVHTYIYLLVFNKKLSTAFHIHV